MKINITCCTFEAIIMIEFREYQDTWLGGCVCCVYDRLGPSSGKRLPVAEQRQTDG